MIIDGGGNASANNQPGLDPALTVLGGIFASNQINGDAGVYAFGLPLDVITYNDGGAQTSSSGVMGIEMGQAPAATGGTTVVLHFSSGTPLCFCDVQWTGATASTESCGPDTTSLSKTAVVFKGSSITDVTVWNWICFGLK